ncbi:MAG TPA: Holliday junction branch migration protein RuvA [Candidatus Binataceae bacterium]|nr:Holliday junction branch migration protein RuvA [Candidatus Binataceae bacterium]
MIATLSGKIKLRESDRLIVETGGVGYEVLIPLSTYYRLPSAGSPVELEIRQVVREDSNTLYGFATLGEKRAFDLLMGVQHVGPKLAMAVLSVLAPADLGTAIVQGDVDKIDAVPGVGPKVAERIVRELRDKTGELSLASAVPAAAIPNGRGTGHPIMDDALSALVNLGYKPAEAKRAIDALGAVGDDEDLEVVIRKSLAVILGEK